MGEMMDQREITLKIDGQTLQVPGGTTVLEAARKAGIVIPTLCHGENLPAAEACRLCVVEVKGEARPLAACATAVKSGMVINTVSPRLTAERETIFRLMIEDHYGDCLPPCTLRCPTNVDIQGYIALIAMGRYQEAARLILRTNPLPLSIGRVCPHPCESMCRRNRVDEPVNINHLKRFCCDITYQNIADLNIVPEPPTGKRVAVIGGGPAGLSVSFYLALKGHEPTIFEAYSDLGGMLRYGIPEYRLPKKILDQEIKAILSAGVKVKTGMVWGRDFTMEDLKKQGFDAIFLGIGAAINRELEFVPPGTQGISYGTIFLSQVALGQDTGLGKRVAVIGGGNTAMDCARTSLRLGAEEVTILYRRSRKEMPAQAIEVDEAELEGVKLELCVAPVDMEGQDGRLTALKFVRMDLGALDESGRARPVPIKGSEFTVPLDTVIMAVGQVADGPVLQKDPIAKQLTFGRDSTVRGDYMTGRTNLEGIFVGGDLMSGPATVVEAIGGGRRAAEAIEHYLRGLPLPALKPFFFSKGGAPKDVDQSNFEGRPQIPREKMPMLEPPERRGNFEEVDLGLTEDQARAEALRCLSCGCQAVEACRIRKVANDLGIRELVIRQTPSQPFKILDRHPHLVVEDGKCIVCRTCERACEHYHGRQAIKVELERVGDLGSYRGHQVLINERCDSCGLCASLCPTGALSFRSRWPKPGPFPLTRAESVCNLCPLGCRLQAGRIGQQLVAIDGSSNPPAHGHLCRRGRFELVEGRDGRERITRPLVRKGDALVEAGWEEAISVLAKGFAGIKETAGSQALAGLSFGRGSLEELYLFGKVVRAGLSTNNIDFVDPAGEETEGSTALSDLAVESLALSYPEIEHQDLVLAIGSNLSQAMPLLEAALHRLGAKGGKLILLGKDQTLAARSALQLDKGPAEAFDLVAEMLRGNSAGQEINPLYSHADKVMVIVAGSAIQPASQAAFSTLLSTVGGVQGKKVSLALIPAVPSGQALAEAGISPVYYPGRKPMNDQNRDIVEKAFKLALPKDAGLFAGQILEAASQGKIKGLLIQAGHNPAVEPPSSRILSALQAVEFLAVIATYQDPLLDRAQVVLPGLFSLEKEGTFVAADGGKCEVTIALPPPEGILPTWRMLSLMLESLSGFAGYGDLQQVRSELMHLSHVVEGS